MIIKEKRRQAAAVHVVNMQAVHIPILFVPYRRSMPFINGRWTATKRCPPLTEVVFLNVYRLLVIGSFGTQNSLHRRLLAACGTLCCKYANVWNSRYLCLLCMNQSTVPQGGVGRAYKREKRIHAGRMRFPRPWFRDNDRSGYKPVRAQFERIACPVALKKERNGTQKSPTSHIKMEEK